MIKLSGYAKRHGICYRTAYDHFRKGLIVGAYQLPTGTVVILDNYTNPNKTEKVVTYARVSSSENKDNLLRQSERLVGFCNAKGWSVSEAIQEIGSGLNDGRPKLLKILKNREATKLVVEHKDRLARFGVNYIKQCCEAFNCELIVVNEVEGGKEDIIQDFISIITSFCARIYGHRKSKRKTEALIKGLSNKP